MEAFVHLVAEAGIRGGAGRVFYPTPLQIRPDVIDEEMANSGYGTAAHGIGLVAVDHDDGIVQEDGLINLNAREKGLVDVLVLLPICCKIKMAKVAKQKSIKLQLEIP